MANHIKWCTVGEEPGKTAKTAKKPGKKAGKATTKQRKEEFTEEEDSSDDSCSASNNTVSPDVYIPPKKSSKWSVTSPESVSQPLRVSEFNLRPRRGSLSYEGMM